MVPQRTTITKSGKGYLVLSFVGFIIPYLAFGNWLVQHGVDPHLFVRDLFANGVSTFFALDVLISAVVLISLVRRNGSLTSGQRWGVIVGTICVGGSFGLPLYLFFDAQRHSRDLSN